MSRREWFDFARKIGLTCGLCTALLTLLGCSDINCRNYDDHPFEQNRGFAGRVKPDPSIGTASGSIASDIIGTIGSDCEDGEK